MNGLKIKNLYNGVRIKLASREKHQREAEISPSSIPSPTLQISDADIPVLPSTIVSKRLSEDIDHQLQSNFFAKLPLEIRLLIYCEVLGGANKVHQNSHANPRKGDFPKDFGPLSTIIRLHCNTSVEDLNGKGRKLPCFAEDEEARYTGQISNWHFLPDPESWRTVQFYADDHVYVPGRSPNINLLWTCRKMSGRKS